MGPVPEPRYVHPGILLFACASKQVAMCLIAIGWWLKVFSVVQPDDEQLNGIYGVFLYDLLQLKEEWVSKSAQVEFSLLPMLSSFNVQWSSRPWRRLSKHET